MKLHIAIPAYQRKVDIGVLASVCGLLSNFDWHISLDFTDLSITSQARNILVRRFLETEAEWLLFWDNDIVISSPYEIHWMRETAERHEAIVSAACRIKGGDNLNCGLIRNNRVELIKELASPRLVDVAGTGLMLIHRKHLTKISDPWFEVIEQPGGVVLGEDFNFCLKAREKGINVAVHPVETMHYGVAGWQYQISKTIAA